MGKGIQTLQEEGDADMMIVNNLEKERILQKLREPTILENNRLGFLESLHET